MKNALTILISLLTVSITSYSQIEIDTIYHYDGTLYGFSENSITINWSKEKPTDDPGVYTRTNYGTIVHYFNSETDLKVPSKYERIQVHQGITTFINGPEISFSNNGTGYVEGKLRDKGQSINTYSGIISNSKNDLFTLTEDDELITYNAISGGLWKTISYKKEVSSLLNINIDSLMMGDLQIHCDQNDNIWIIGNGGIICKYLHSKKWKCFDTNKELAKYLKGIPYYVERIWETESNLKVAGLNNILVFNINSTEDIGFSGVSILGIKTKHNNQNYLYQSLTDNSGVDFLLSEVGVQYGKNDKYKTLSPIIKIDKTIIHTSTIGKKYGALITESISSYGNSEISDATMENDGGINIRKVRSNYDEIYLNGVESDEYGSPSKHFLLSFKDKNWVKEKIPFTDPNWGRNIDIEQDINGTVWLSTDGDGILLFSKGKWNTLDWSNGLISNHITNCFFANETTCIVQSERMDEDGGGSYISVIKLK
jgi:hypothetical protein